MVYTHTGRYPGMDFSSVHAALAGCERERSNVGWGCQVGQDEGLGDAPELARAPMQHPALFPLPWVVRMGPAPDPSGHQSH